jgi:hypothetical protein
MGLDRVGPPPGRTVLAAVTGRWLRAQPGRSAVLPGAGPPGAGGRSLASGTGALMWALHLVIHGNPVSPSSRRAGGNVTAWLYFRRRDHRHGRAPWPGPHRGPADLAGGPHARGARAGPCADGYGSAALFLISLVSHPSRVADGGQPGPGGPALRGTVRIPACVARHPKVPAGWNVAVRRSVTRRCYTTMSWAVRWFDLTAASSRSTSRRLRPLARHPGRRAAGRLPARR